MTVDRKFHALVDAVLFRDFNSKMLIIARVFHRNFHLEVELPAIK
jgi:hypothetical protein